MATRTRLLLIVGAVLGAVVLVGAGAAVGVLVATRGSGAETVTTTAASEPERPVDPLADVPTSDDPAEDEPTTPSDEGEVGQDDLEDDGITFRVTSLEPVQQVATGEFSDGPLTPPEGAKLVQAVVEWTNDTGQSRDIFCGGGGAILVDQDGDNYDPVGDVTDIAANDQVCGDGVNPGFSSTITLAFELPEDARTEGIALWNSEDDDDPDGDTFVLFVK